METAAAAAAAARRPGCRSPRRRPPRRAVRNARRRPGLPARRRLHDRRLPESRGEDPRREGDPDLAQPLVRLRLRAAISPLPERLQEQPLHLHARVGRAAPGRRGGHTARRLGLDRRRFALGGRRRALQGGALRSPRRQRRVRRDGPRRAAAAPGAPARRHHSPDRVPREAAPDLRPDRLRARLLPRRPVVPEDRGLRAGGHARPQDGRLELPCVPRELRVLCGLRALRRLAHCAEPIRRRRHRRARFRVAEGRPDDLPLRPGRRARLRLDGRPALPGRPSSPSIRPATFRPAGAQRPRASSG